MSVKLIQFKTIIKQTVPKVNIAITLRTTLVLMTQDLRTPEDFEKMQRSTVEETDYQE